MVSPVKSVFFLSRNIYIYRPLEVISSTILDFKARSFKICPDFLQYKCTFIRRFGPCIPTLATASRSRRESPCSCWTRPTLIGGTSGKLLQYRDFARDEVPVLAKKPDPGLCTSNEGRIIKALKANILDNFKSLLSCFHTFGGRRTIDVL